LAEPERCGQPNGGNRVLLPAVCRPSADPASLDAVPRLLAAAAAAQTARLLNVSELAVPFQLRRPTIRDHVTLLARIFLLEELPSGATVKRLPQPGGIVFVPSAPPGAGH
jgi:hypothetical protein